MAVKLVEVTRGKVTESLSRGDVAVTDGEGRIIYYAGDPHKYTYMRSSAKPLQALQVYLSGAAQHYGFSSREIAVMCGSHYGEPVHRQTVENILDKIGLTRNNLLGGTVTSLNPSYALQLEREGVELNPLFSDCSGKHAGMLAVCQYKGYPVDHYISPDHPLQQEIIQLIAGICRYEAENIAIGIDGCSVPVHALPLSHMAQGYARLTTTSLLPGEQQAAAGSIFTAMNRHPEMVAGTHGFCTELIRHTHGKLIGKIGAEGVYCIGLKNKNMGIAVKMEDGSMNRLPPVVMEVLNQLDLLSHRESQGLETYRYMDNLNDVHWKVGSIQPVFKLNKANEC
ncbi:MAG: asparaginase [Bacteroidales bacterium]|nr:asparaginase [Bacteroidales bacterium]